MLFVVAVALMDGAGQVLMQQRPAHKPMAGYWEFPGGKVQGGETPEAALIRELHEELAITIEPSNLQPLTFTTYPLNPKGLQPDGKIASLPASSDEMMLLLLYRCSRWQGEPKAEESQQFRWVLPEALADMPLPPADIPFIPYLNIFKP